MAGSKIFVTRFDENLKERKRIRRADWSKVTSESWRVWWDWEYSPTRRKAKKASENMDWYKAIRYWSDNMTGRAWIMEKSKTGVTGIRMGSEGGMIFEMPLRHWRTAKESTGLGHEFNLCQNEIEDNLERIEAGDKPWRNKSRMNCNTWKMDAGDERHWAGDLSEEEWQNSASDRR